MLLDHQVGSNGHDLESNDLLVTFDLELFYQESRFSSSSSDEMALPAKLVSLQLRSLLKHPLVETFMQLKWNQTRLLFYANVLLFGLFTISLTAFALISTQIGQGCRGFVANASSHVGILDCIHAIDEEGSWQASTFWVSQSVTVISFGVVLTRELLQGVFAGPR